MTGAGSPLGHNGGPPLDYDDGRPPTPRYCKYCRYWSPPPDRDIQAYEWFRLGLTRRRAKRPSGSCDRVLMRLGGPLSFSATTDTFGCHNFSAKPAPPIQRGRSFVTIYEDDRIVWRGHEEDVPDAYR